MKRLIFLIILIILNVISLPNAYGSCGAMTENQIALAADEKLQELLDAQVALRNGTGSYLPECPGSVCWNTTGVSDSIIASTSHLKVMLGVFSPGFNLVVSGCVHGDVRFRCRYQKNDLICFAIRCELEGDYNPCKQRWRIERKIDGGAAKCVDVGVDDGACAGF